MTMYVLKAHSTDSDTPQGPCRLVFKPHLIIWAIQIRSHVKAEIIVARLLPVVHMAKV